MQVDAGAELHTIAHGEREKLLPKQGSLSISTTVSFYKDPTVLNYGQAVASWDRPTTCSFIE
eukprot:3457774-Rhodomonas_salina.3